MLPEYVWQYTSPTTGPSVTIIGGTHGDELTGIGVVDTLKKVVEDQGILAGTLTLLYGNPKAIERGTRGSEDHADLNRAFTAERLADASRNDYETVRARTISPLLQQSDILIDLHATSKPSQPFSVIPIVDDAHINLAAHFPTPEALTYPIHVLPGTTFECVAEHNCVSIAYESGQASDVEKVEETLRAVRGFLAAQGILEGEHVPLQPTQRVFEVQDEIFLSEAGFRFAEGRGLKSFEAFQTGDVLGWAGEEPVVAPFDGVMMFPTAEKFWQLGKPVAALAKTIKIIDVNDPA